jgi:hypothetical protein
MPLKLTPAVIAAIFLAVDSPIPLLLFGVMGRQKWTFCRTVCRHKTESIIATAGCIKKSKTADRKTRLGGIMGRQRYSGECDRDGTGKFDEKI